MDLIVRPMTLEETALIVDYFHGASPEHLDMMGVDPSRLPPRAAMADAYARDFARPVEARAGFLVIWLEDGRPIGFSTTNKIRFGEEANMHLHVAEPSRRNSGVGAECVKKSVEIYFDTLKLKRLFCEPHALNIAPNRTLQKAGFRYVKTYMTVPGAINFHQPVTRWVIER